MATKKIAGITIELDADTSKVVKSMDAVAKKVDAVGQSLQKVGTSLTKNLTAPIVAVGAASVKAFNEVDEGLDTITQKTGATGEEAEAMGEIMKNLATSIPTDFATAGEAIGEVRTRFGVTGDALEDLSGQFIKFAQLNNTDVSNSIDSVQKALSAYGLGAEDAGAFLDRLNKTAQETGASVDSLEAGIVSNATAFKEMGLGIDEAVAFMGQLEVSGANSETVLNGMRKALKNATAEGKPLDQALAELQNTILNGTDSMDGLTAAYDIFGKSGDQIYGAVKDGTINFVDLASAMTDAGNSVADTFEATLDPTDNFKTTMNELKVVGADVGGTLLQMLIPVIKQVGEIITKVKEAWEGLSPETQEMIIKAAGIVAAVGPVLLVIGKVVSGISSIISIGSALVAAIGAISAPVVAVVAVIAGLIAIGVALYKNWDEICAWANRVKEQVSESWNNMKQNVSESWNNMKQNASQAMDAIKNKVEQNGGGIKGVLKTAVEGYVNLWKAGFEQINNLTGGKLGEALNTVTSKLNQIKNTFTNVFDGAKQIVSNAINYIRGLLSGELSFPHIRMPHFSISGEFSLDPPSVPHISVEWYKKAMTNPFMLNGATIFGAMGGKLLGGGESGSEMIVGTNKLMQMIAQAKGGETVINNQFTINATDKDPQELAQEISFYLDMELQRTERAFA